MPLAEETHHSAPLYVGDSRSEPYPEKAKRVYLLCHGRFCLQPLHLPPGSTDTPMARDGLMAEPYGLSHEQADAILALRLGRLTSMEEGKLKAEAEELQATMER